MQSAKMIGTLSLNPAIDKIVTVRDFQWGEHIRVRKMRQVAAGKGINVARVIKKLGGDVVILGVSGGPNGEWIEHELKKEKLKFDFIPVKRNVRESLTIMDEKSGREIHLREEGQEISKGELGLIRSRLRKWVPRLRFLVISGRLPRGVPLNFYGEIISFFKKRNIPVLLDSNGPAFVRALGAIPDYIKPNLKELEEAAGKRLPGRREKIRFIKTLIKRGINMVVLTNGPQEVLAITSDWGVALSPPKVRVRNTVGSGDAVTGALAYGLAPYPCGMGLALNLHIHRILKLAIACGSANTLSEGPGFLDRKKVNALIKKVDFSCI